MSSISSAAASWSPEKLLRDFLESAEQARAAHQVGWRLFECGPSDLVRQRYGTWFEVLEVGAFHMLVLGVTRIFDSDPRHPNIFGLLRELQPTLGVDRCREYKRRLQPLLETVNQAIKPIRDRHVAHLSPHHIFEETLGERSPINAAFLNQLAAILNDLKTELHIESEQVTQDERYADATRKMMHALETGAQMLPEDAALPPLRWGLGFPH